MKNSLLWYRKPALLLFLLLWLQSQAVFAQPATISIPVADGSTCGAGAAADSMKYFNFNATTNTLTHRSNCKPGLAAPGFSSNLSTVTFNPFDGNLYFSQISLVAGVYNTYTYRWLPTVCPGSSYPVFTTFMNQFVAGVEFDPATGLGYQINFVDTTGLPPVRPATSGTIGQYASGAIVNGLPAAAFYQSSSGGNLYYVQAKDVNGVDWQAPVLVASGGNVGQYATLRMVNGYPAIVYFDVTNADLKFVRATDVNGTTWGTPVTLDATGNVGQYASFEIVNGNPAVAYHDATNADLKYIRATNVNGTAWAAPVIVDAPGLVGLYASLKVVNGNPAIAYYDQTNTDLKYARATDANGSAWGVPTLLEFSASNRGQFTSLEVVNGSPAISYYDLSTQDLRYIRATDANGSGWAASLAVATGGTIGQYTSLAVINGNPAISFYDATNLDLKYIRATDADGAAWGPLLTPEAAGTKGQYTSLFVVNGNPAIMYYDGSGGDLSYIRCRDANGDVWYFNSNVFSMELQEVNFTTGVLGALKPIDFGTHYIYRQSGDVVMTPGGQMLAVFNNKYFTVNWKDYSTPNPLVATYIDTIKMGASNVVGLAYSGGKLISSARTNNSPCRYDQINILTGALSPVINGAATLFSGADMTNIACGIGSAKRLVSATENPVGSGTYDIVYELFIKNYGGTPVSDVQVYDTLNFINGVANVLSASITSFTAPAGFTANGSYNGKTAGNFNLLNPGGTLSNIPGKNTITIQITCRISNIVPGIVYNNQAVVSGTSIFGDAIRDLSTNGSDPDLNSNDTPDDIGESQPTPLLIAVAAQTPPCATLSKVLFSQDFGAGTGLTTALPPPVPGTGVTGISQTSTYGGSVLTPLPLEKYVFTNNAKNANTADYISLTDHTGNANGRMMVINADASNNVFYRGIFSYTLCPKQQYSVSFYAAFIGNASYGTICNAFGGFKYPKVKVRVRDGVTGLIITETSTADITSTGWQQYGVKFVSPATYTSIIFDLINDAPGGCGNDIAIDDVQFGSCDPIPVISVNSVAGCLGGQSTFSGSLSDPGAIPGPKEYQWQVGPTATGPWADIVGATAATYTILSVAPADTGKYYRLILAALGNIGSPSCRFNSPPAYLIGKTLSAAATSASKNKDNICAGISVSLGLTGGSLGTGAGWEWFSTTCGSALQGTGNTISVMPSVTTTYLVRATGECNTTACVPVTIFINCNIDKDRDGIPDYVESYMPAALADHNANGISNAFDPLYPGFKDYNNDHINDDFQADGDSDNDGIPNYLDTTFPGRVDSNGDGIDDRFDMDLDGIINMLDLDSDNDGIADVVEAGGVDVNGDGKIDNFTDTDNDGLSQNVDGNNTGARLSGVGLGPVDLDGDGKPSAIDLDSDGDGIPDVVECGGPDVNNNGRIDGFVDANGDGLIDTYINATALLRTGADINNDGKADSYPFKNFDNDRRPNCYDVDSDMDGIIDVIEAGFTDANFDGFIDGPISADGWNTALHLRATLGLRNSDSDPNPDYLDIDSDGDGIPDNIEGQTTAGYKFAANADTDNDGLDNAYDLAPYAATFGGYGLIPPDKDIDGIPDYLDLDTDSDGTYDINEGHDYNFNGIADDLVTPLGTDADGDGLDDRFDLINSTTNLKGTSSMMGNGGSLTGDATPGSSATVQKHVITQADRDWRDVTYVLPLQYLELTGAESKSRVSLNWAVMASSALDVFEVERSTDNRHFEKIATLAADITLDKINYFASTDQVADVNSTVIFYRIKVIGRNGQHNYSNVILIRKNLDIKPLSIFPNPAKNAATISFYAEQENEVTVTIKDNLGKQVYLNKLKAQKGNNVVPISNLNRYSNGVYSVQVLVNNELVTVRLIIQN